MKNLNEHPEVGKRVEITFINTRTDIESHRDGIWDGQNWLFRKPYTKDEYIAPPEHIKLTGWSDVGYQKKAYE